MNFDIMKYYIVGGAVRDMLLDYEPKDIDFVVVGAEQEDMINLYGDSVGEHFPVHIGIVPDFEHLGKVEIAMARTECKIPYLKGHKAFRCEFGKNITLEQDLERRDFTINAMALEPYTNEIIDPYNGQKDLKNKVIKHVNKDAFIDDPLRALRMARFAATLNFNIYPETLELSKKIDLSSLPIERIWVETQKALSSKNPRKYFDILLETGHLKQFLPELTMMVNVPHFYHIEDPFEHTMLVMQEGVNFDLPSEAIYALLLHDIGKAFTPEEVLPHHYEHDKVSAVLAKEISDRLKVPIKYKKLSVWFAKNHMKLYKINEMSYKTLTKLSVDIIKSKLDPTMIIKMSLSDALGRKADTFYDNDYERLLQAIEIVSKIDAKDIVEKGVTGIQVGELLHQKRVEALRKAGI